jgi:hypothetical protein
MDHILKLNTMNAIGQTFWAIAYWGQSKQQIYAQMQQQP